MQSAARRARSVAFSRKVADAGPAIGAFRAGPVGVAVGSDSIVPRTTYFDSGRRWSRWIVNRTNE